MRVWLAVLLASTTAHAEVSVKEYAIPPGHGIHDVWAAGAPGDPVWFSAQRSGHLGILDPKTGAVHFVALGRGAAPHGVIAGPDGAAWLTDGGRNAIVRVDARSGALRSWKLPGNGFANLNTGTFDGAGIHWFTGQSGIYGRLDPRSGAMTVFAAPRGVGPYGITATPGGGARRVGSDSKGNVWVAEWNSGTLSRYSPASGRWSTWRAPGEAPRLYAVYVDERDKVWTSEWSAQVILRFDPQSEKFEVFRSSSTTANVRQIHGRRGEVWTPESAADKIVVYRYE